jgi:hypothetical protein
VDWTDEVALCIHAKVKVKKSKAVQLHAIEALGGREV